MAEPLKTRGKRFTKGGAPGPGRPKGATSEVEELRAQIKGALDDEGGRAYLRRAARKSPKAFLALLGRVVPREVHSIVEVTVSLDYSRREPKPEMIDAHARAMPQMDHAQRALSSEIFEAELLPSEADEVESE